MFLYCSGLASDTGTVPACVTVHGPCAGDDGVGALWRSYAPGAECVAAAAFPECSCEPEGHLLDLESCERAGSLLPFCGQAELLLQSMRALLLLIDAHFWTETETRLQVLES